VRRESTTQAARALQVARGAFDFAGWVEPQATPNVRAPLGIARAPVPALGFAALSANLFERRPGSDAPRKPRPAGGRFDRAPGVPRRDGGFKPGGKPGEFKPGGNLLFCVGKDLRRGS